MHYQTKTLAIALIAGVALSGCGFNPVKIAGKVTGNVAGKEIAKVTPPPATKTEVEPRGGKFCDVTSALGWPPEITDDKLNLPLNNAVANLLDHGAQYCDWKGPQS